MHTADQSTNYSDPLHIAGRAGHAAFQRQMPGHIERLAKTRMQNENKPEKINTKILKKLTIIAITLLIAAVAMFATAHFFGDSLSRAGHSSSTKNLEIVIGNEYLRVPSNKVRFYSQRSSGAHEKLDLYIHWPSLSGYRDSLSSDFNNSNEDKNLVFISIEPRSMSFDMSGRVTPIYTLNFLKESLWQQALAL